MQRGKKRRRTVQKAPTTPPARALIEPIVEFLYRSGLSKKHLLAECRSAIRKSSTSKAKLDVIHVGFGKDVIDIVNRWLRDPSYLNHFGRPDELPLTGARSLSSLAGACNVSVTPTKALAQLLQFGIVKQIASRRYRLIHRSMDFWHSDYLPFEPNFRFLVDATRAATNRLRLPKTKNRLFWQCADNSRIHPRYTKDFLGFVKQRGLSFMHEINDWLDEHESVDARTPSRAVRQKRLGVGLFGIGSDLE